MCDWIVNPEARSCGSMRLGRPSRMLKNQRPAQKSVPQGLKPIVVSSRYGTTKVVPLEFLHFSSRSVLGFERKNLSRSCVLLCIRARLQSCHHRTKKTRAFSPCYGKTGTKYKVRKQFSPVQLRYSAKKKPQGLKPSSVLGLAARLKSCPDTKPNRVSLENIVFTFAKM